MIHWNLYIENYVQFKNIKETSTLYNVVKMQGAVRK